MDDYTRQNKDAWEFDAYNFWVKDSGTPAERAEKTRRDPRGMLRKHAAYFDDVRGVRIANVCGSCGKKAVPLALLGARVTLFDLSAGNLRYARELAREAGVALDCVEGDVLETAAAYTERFDVVFTEGGVLHYFHDPGRFLRALYGMLAAGGRLVLSDFHPFRKCMRPAELSLAPLDPPDYFNRDVLDRPMPHSAFYPADTQRQIPTCRLRYHTLGDILNAAVAAGFAIVRLDEHPSWDNAALPGEFTLLADRRPD